VVAGDPLGDACDDDMDGDGRNVVYVRNSGMDDNLGTFIAPVKTLAKAVSLAKQRKAGAVYVSAGVYDISNVKFEDGIDIKGSFAENFLNYLQYPKNGGYKSVLENGHSPVTLFLKDFSGTFALDGFYIGSSATADDVVGPSGIIPDTDDYGCTQATVYLVNSQITLSNNVITVGNKATKPCGVLLGAGAGSAFNANKISAAGSSEADSSTGVSIVGAPAVLTNNIIIAGSGEHSFGVRMTDSSAKFVNNTIDATSLAASPKVAYGVTFNKGSPQLINNLVFTDGAFDQAVLACTGGELSGAKFQNNLLTTFPQTGTSAALIDCEGVFRLISDYNANPTFSLDGAVISGNTAYSGAKGGLVDASYNLVGGAGVNAGASASLTADYNGGARPKGGAFDVGAIEKQ
jgi:hypothetical protein